jgi:predicted transposase YdaD
MSKSLDHIFRENIVAVFETFVREVLGVRPEWSVRVELGQPKTSEREPDYLRRVKLPGVNEPVVLHIEFQTKSDAQMHLRMLEYNVLLRRRFGLEVRQYVLLLRGKGEAMRTEIREDDLVFRYRLVRLQDIDFRRLLDSGVPELIVAAVLADFKRNDARGVIRRILVALRRQVTDERELQKYLTQLEILSNITGYTSVVNQEIKDMPLTFNKHKDIRYQQGRLEGRLEGKLEGNTRRLAR